MYKIAFVVVILAFALQGTVSSPAAEANVRDEVEDLPNADVNEQAVTTTTLAPVSTTSKNSGASTSQTCILLVQISSLALITKHLVL